MKRNHKFKEFDQLQKIKREVEKLKRENTALRKQLARIDYTRFQNLKDLVDKQNKEDKELQHKKKSESLKQQWVCRECGKGFLYIKMFDHPTNGVTYWRACNLCTNRTKAQKYTPSVEGLMEEDEE
jgi:rubredoxin